MIKSHVTSKKKLKHRLLIIPALLAFLLLSYPIKSQAPVTSMQFGLNGWYIDLTNLNPSAAHIDSIMQIAQVAGAKWIRIGGIQATFEPLYSFDQFDAITTTKTNFLKNLIVKIRAYGMEPILQVSYDHITCSPPPVEWTLHNKTLADQATIAANLVDFLNVNSTTKLATPIKYWSIANEPDRPISCTFPGDGFSLDGSNNNEAVHAQDIATYIKEFSKEMKAKDNTIKIIAPDLASFSADVNSDQNKLWSHLVDDPANAGSIMGVVPNQSYYYVDILSLHRYPYKSTRQDVIDQPQADGSMQDVLFSNSSTRKGIVTMINSNNTARSFANLKVAITEINLGNHESNLHEGTNNTGMVNGIGNRSYLGGQWMAESMCESILQNSTSPWLEFFVPWSIREGDCSSGLGITSNCNSNAAPYRRRSTFYHYRLVANYFKGDLYKGSLNPSTTNGENIKIYASRLGCKEVAVLIMNQETTSQTVKFSWSNTYPTTSSNYLEAKVDLGSSTQRDITLSGEESAMMVYDVCGTLKYRFKYSAADYIADDGYDYHNTGAFAFCNCTRRVAPWDGPIGIESTSYAFRCADLVDIGTPQYYNDYNVTASMVLTDTVWINGTFHISNEAHVEFQDAIVNLGEGAEIVVEDNSILNISNSVFFSCTGTTWKGITINNSALQMNGSKIISADVAVTLQNSPDAIISDNLFEKGTTAINIVNSAPFTVTENEIIEFETGIRTQDNLVAENIISENLIYKTGKAISFNNDDHSELVISCNKLVDYTVYGIVSDSTILADQGTSSIGAGNIFVNVSGGSDHQILHNGAMLTYYADPDAPLTLDTSVTRVNVLTATDNAPCNTISSSARFANNASHLKEIEETFNDMDNRVSQLFDCFPNPSSSSVTFKYELEKENIYLLKITDLLGKKAVSVPLEEGNNETKINFDTWPGGIYIYSLIENGTTISSKKFILTD